MWKRKCCGSVEVNFLLTGNRMAHHGLCISQLPVRKLIPIMASPCGWLIDFHSSIHTLSNSYADLLETAITAGP